ncbi:hypothetical protein CLV30_101415 [Haloactinopolyspora alba]|uniref:Uncharacterized protein n=1 Tax=Haloactinopolyspora alba TaxID=648780 RepID=A0A2P8EG45_9ACTN|nr:hypothetical protein CLV30_101415 [Haloactinopolyspora alba]
MGPVQPLAGGGMVESVVSVQHDGCQAPLAEVAYCRI